MGFSKELRYDSNIESSHGHLNDSKRLIQPQISKCPNSPKHRELVQVPEDTSWHSWVDVTKELRGK